MKFGNCLLLSIGIVSSCSGVNPSSNNNQVSIETSSENIENTVETTYYVLYRDKQ